MTEKREEEEEDIAIDFSKIKNLFSGLTSDGSEKKSREEPGGESEEDAVDGIGEALELNLEDIKLFLTNKKFLITSLILIALFFSIYFRAYPAHLPTTDDWAENNVERSVKKQISLKVSKQYPNLPPKNKKEMVNERFSKFMEENRDKFQPRIEKMSNQFKKEFKDDSGQTYLLAIDPYQFYRLSKNIVETGGMGTGVKDGKQWDYQSVAPKGRPVSPNLHHWVEVWFYRFLSLFNSNLSFMTAVFWLPVILSALAVIPAFFIAERKAGIIGGFLSAMLVAVHPAFLGRTAAGFSDTDPYNILLPLLIVWAFLEAFEADSFNKRAVLGSVTGLLVGVFSFAWIGWWYIFDVLIAVLIVFLVYLFVKNWLWDSSLSFDNKRLLSPLQTSAFFILSSGVFVTLFSSFSTFLNGFKGPINFLSLKQAVHKDLWPNVYTTVAELNTGNISGIIKQLSMGNTLFFIAAGIGIVLTLVNLDDLGWKEWSLLGGSFLVFLFLISKKGLSMSIWFYLLIFSIPVLAGGLLTLVKKGIDVKYALLLSGWFIGSMFASTKGARFVMVIVPAFSISFGIFWGCAKKILTRNLAKNFEVSREVLTPIISLIILAVLISPVSSAHKSAKNEVPSMNDAWWSSLKKIESSSEEDAIITSWWDFGHWFKAVADRPVTFDGASQNSPMAHWVGKLLQTSDEEEAVSILRMLDCGSNNAFEVVDERFNDTVASVKIVKKILPLTKDKAEEFLRKEDFSEERISRVLESTHCTPPEGFVIASKDMVGKASVWSHFGLWSFEKAYVYNELKDKPSETAVSELVDRFNYSKEKAEQLYFDAQSLTTDKKANSWISPWPNYNSGWKQCSEKPNKSLVACSLGMNLRGSQGGNVRLERAVINTSDLNSSYLSFSVYNSQTNTRVKEGERISPAGFVVAKNHSLKRIPAGDGEESLRFDLVIDLQKGPKALIASPKLSTSMFTRLFFFNGRYLDYFNDFHKETNPVTGNEIHIYKADWEEFKKRDQGS